MSFCPLAGMQCPGEESCKPAVLHADQIKEHLPPAQRENVRAVCPITAVVQDCRVVASALLPLLLGEDKEQPTEESEGDIRNRLIESLDLPPE